MAKKDELKETTVSEVPATKVETHEEQKTEGLEVTEKAPEVPAAKIEEKTEENKAPEVQKELDKRALKTSALVSGSLYAAGTLAHQIKAEHLELIDSKYFE